MNLQKLKKWFRRQRRGGSDAEERPSPAPRQTAPSDGASGADAGPAGLPTTAQKAPPLKKHQTAPKAAAGKIGERPVTRQGIPILKPDEDLSVHFNDTPADGMPPAPAAGAAGGPADRQARSGTSSGRSSSIPTGKPLRRNRLGIRRLDDDADLRDYFMPASGNASERDTPAPTASTRTKHTARKPLRNIPTDRHGIPRLDNQVDLKRLFDATVDETEGAEALGETLRQSLANDARALMQKKTGGFFPPRRLSLKDKLRRYPAPQAQLDLHGFTAPRARQRADAFIRAARADGLFTLRVIVGKGLHSEDRAVLPDVIEDLLVDLKREAIVLSYRWEKRVKRKSGALIVFLSPPFP